MRPMAQQCFLSVLYAAYAFRIIQNIRNKGAWAALMAFCMRRMRFV